MYKLSVPEGHNNSMYTYMYMKTYIHEYTLILTFQWEFLMHFVKFLCCLDYLSHILLDNFNFLMNYNLIYRFFFTNCN